MRLIVEKDWREITKMKKDDYIMHLEILLEDSENEAKRLFKEEFNIKGERDE